MTVGTVTVVGNHGIPVRGLKPIPKSSRLAFVAEHVGNHGIPVRGLKPIVKTTSCAQRRMVGNHGIPVRGLKPTMAIRS